MQFQFVTVYSPSFEDNLGKTMNLTVNPTNNPLLKGSGLPDFANIKPEHIVPAITQLLAELDRELTTLETNFIPNWDEFIEPLSLLQERLRWSRDLVNHLREVKNSPQLRDAYETVQPPIVQFYNRMNQSQAIYNAFVSLCNSDNWETLDSAQQRIVEIETRKAKLSGVCLQGEAKERFNAIQMELAELSTKFSNNLLDATEAFSLTLTNQKEIDGLPSSLLSLAAQAARDTEIESATTENGPWVITLDYPSYIPFLKYSNRRDLREKLYKAYITRASSGELDNNPMIERILALRSEQAELLGFNTYAELSFVSKMARDVDAVEKLLEELRWPSYDAALKELEELKAFAVSKGAPSSSDLQHWDITYWQERLREEKFGFNAEELRPYFSFSQVLESLFALTYQLFGVTITPVDGQTSVWHPDVRYFQIADETRIPIANFYLDAYSRPAEKLSGAWMFGCSPRYKITKNGVTTICLPVVYLVCNQTPPVDGKPSLMTFDEVVELFHEFGHGLHEMLTKVDYPQVAGTENIETDAIEILSQFMENWCYYKPTIMGMAKHYSTGEPLPEHYYQKLLAAKNYMNGTAMLHWLHLSYLDLELHHRYRPSDNLTPRDVRDRIAKTTMILPPLEVDGFLCTFRHIFEDQYAAGYYSYLWAEVLSADAFAAFEEAGLDDIEAITATGRRFRDTVLALGGSKHPMEVFESFRGRQISTKLLLRHRGLANVTESD